MTGGCSGAELIAIKAVPANGDGAVSCGTGIVANGNRLRCGDGKITNRDCTDGELSSRVAYSSAPDQSWTYDPIGRMESSTLNGPGTSYDATWSYTRNAASQIKTETQTNDFYSWDGFVAVDRNYTTNGLNQYTSVSGQAYCYDANGNLTADGTYVYLYDVENRLVEMRAKANSNCSALAYTGEIKAALRYDPMGRLYEVTNYINGVSQGPIRFVHDGDALVAEFDANGNLIRRHVHGPNIGTDDPLVSYEGTSTDYTNARFHQTDPRGSIIYSSDYQDGNRVVNSYDEYGNPGSANAGRFQYTGQVWLPELGMYYYKARIYSPRWGRFMQTDPIGYEDNVNLYGYVGQDPVNAIDPTGLATEAEIADAEKTLASLASAYRRAERAARSVASDRTASSQERSRAQTRANQLRNAREKVESIDAEEFADINTRNLSSEANNFIAAFRPSAGRRETLTGVVPNDKGFSMVPSTNQTSGLNTATGKLPDGSIASYHPHRGGDGDYYPGILDAQAVADSGVAAAYTYRNFTGIIHLQGGRFHLEALRGTAPDFSRSPNHVRSVFAPF